MEEIHRSIIENNEFIFYKGLDIDYLNSILKLKERDLKIKKIISQEYTPLNFLIVVFKDTKDYERIPKSSNLVVYIVPGGGDYNEYIDIFLENYKKAYQEYSPWMITSKKPFKKIIKSF